MAGKDATRRQWQVPTGDLQLRLRILEQSPTSILYGLLFFIWELAPGLLLDLSRDLKLNHGPPNYHET